MKRFAIIFVIAAIAGIINGVIIFNLTHQYGYATDVMPAIMAMSGDDKIIIVDSEQDYKNFSAYAEGYNIYRLTELPELIDRAWLILGSDNFKKSEDPNTLIDGFHVISEIVSDDYAAYELEKLQTQCYNVNIRGVAQLVAHAVWDREVAGSSPVAPTT